MERRYLGYTRRWWIQELVIIPLGWLLALWFVFWLFNTQMTYRIVMFCWFSGLIYKFLEWIIRIGDRVDD